MTGFPVSVKTEISDGRFVFTITDKTTAPPLHSCFGFSQEAILRFRLNPLALLELVAHELNGAFEALDARRRCVPRLGAVARRKGSDKNMTITAIQYDNEPMRVQFSGTEDLVDWSDCELIRLEDT